MNSLSDFKFLLVLIQTMTDGQTPPTFSHADIRPRTRLFYQHLCTFPPSHQPNPNPNPSSSWCTGQIALQPEGLGRSRCKSSTRHAKPKHKPKNNIEIEVDNWYWYWPGCWKKYKMRTSPKWKPFFFRTNEKTCSAGSSSYRWDSSMPLLWS